jgi:hypothetical protein
VFTLSLVAGSVLLFAANLLIWVNSTVFDSSEFAETVDGVLDEPEVKDRLAQVLAQQALASGEVEAELVARLPENVSFLEPVVTTQLEPALERVLRTLLDSGFVGNLRNEVLLTLHSQLISILEDDDTALRAQGDDLVLDLSVLFERLLDRLNVEPPERLGGADAPARLLGGDGTVVLLEDTTGLREASLFVENRTELSAVLLGASIICFGAAILFNRDKRQGLTSTGYAVIGVGLATLLLIFLGNWGLESAAEERIVLREGVKALESNLKLQALGLMVLGACLVAATDRKVIAWAGSVEARLTPLIRQVDSRVLLAIAALAALLLIWV